MSKSSSHVYQRASGYYACVNVLKDVLRFVKKCHLRYSLHTRLIFVKVQACFRTEPSGDGSLTGAFKLVVSTTLEGG